MAQTTEKKTLPAPEHLKIQVVNITGMGGQGDQNEWST